MNATARVRARARGLLLATCGGLLAACVDVAPTEPGASDAPPAPTAPTAPATSGSAIPSQFVGDWTAGTVSLLSFYDSHSGAYQGTTGGLSISFRFKPNGEYVFYLYVLQRPTAWCTREAWTELRGRVAFDGDRFVTRATSGRFKGSNNCAASENFDRAATAAELAERSTTYHWYVSSNDDGKTYLRIGQDLSNRDHWSYFSRTE